MILIHDSYGDGGMTKKIGILTLPLVENFGGILQAVALYGFLDSKGYDVSFLKNSHNYTEKWDIKKFFKFISLKTIRESIYIYRKVSGNAPFLREYLPQQTRLLKYKSDYEAVNSAYGFDAVVVGSDQVWRWEYIQNGYRRYFLDFIDAKSTKKIAYAASFGTSAWESPELRPEIVKLLRDFRAISTREFDGVDICKTLGRSDCVHVLDPTLLVPASFYERFTSPPVIGRENKYILSYILDKGPQVDGLLHKIQVDTGGEIPVLAIGLDAKLTVDKWVDLFSKASYIVTDSYHGLLFSIIFKKKFTVVVNRKRGASRFDTVLSLFNLQHRAIELDYIKNGFVSGFFDCDINYGLVSGVLDEHRNISSNYLIEAIENG